ncbi:hypothetical protein ACFX1T_014962 [Malus domestica]
MEMIVKMPMGGVVFEWDGLLGGCRIHGHVETAKKAAEQVTELDLKMRNVFSMQLRKNGTMLRMLESRLDGVTHEFIAGDCLHRTTEAIIWF